MGKILENGDLMVVYDVTLPSGKRLHNELENPPMLLMGKSTISVAIFNSFLYVYQRVHDVQNDTFGDKR